MTSLEDRLTAIAHMMDEARTYSRAEVLVWHELISHVDRDCFERTGRIRAKGPSPEIIAKSASRGDPGLSAEEVTVALEHLRSRGHLVAEHQLADGQVHYQLFLVNRTDVPVSRLRWGPDLDPERSRDRQAVFHDTLTGI